MSLPPPWNASERSGSQPASPDNLVGPTRTRLAEVTKQLELVQSLLTRWSAATNSRVRLSELQQALDEAQAAALAAAGLF